MRALDAVRLAQAIDQAVVGDDVRLEPLLPHPPEQPASLVDPPPRRLPAPRAHPDPAVPGDEDRVRVGVGRAASAGALHLVEQEPGVLEPPVPAQRSDQGVVALRVGGAAKLAQAVERGERLAREAFLPERADDVGERGGGDERGVRAEEAEERRERAGADEREHRGAERGLGERDVGVGPREEGEGEGGGEAAVGGGRGGGEGALRAEAAGGGGAGWRRWSAGRSRRRSGTGGAWRRSGGVGGARQAAAARGGTGMETAALASGEGRASAWGWIKREGGNCQTAGCILVWSTTTNHKHGKSGLSKVAHPAHISFTPVTTRI
jgi:hypothetical protein